MIDFLKNGGLIFTLPLTVMLLINIVLISRIASFLFANKFSSKESTKKQVDYVKHVGLFALTFGILGQIIGLYGAFKTVEMWGDIESNMLIAGIKVSSIPTLYGLGIFSLSYLVWLLLKKQLDSLNV